MLEPLAHAPFDARCYETLIDRPRSSIAEVARAVDADPTRVATTLTTLERDGLVDRVEDDRYLAVPPHLAVELLGQRQRTALAEARVRATELDRRYRRTHGQGPDELVEVIHGREEVTHRFAELERSATDELLVLVKPPFVTRADDHADSQEQLLRDGVRVRCLYERGVVEDPDDPSWATRHVAAGEEARVLGELPMKMVVRDRDRALIPIDVTDPGSSRALLVHPCGLLDALLTMADLLWARATPLVAALHEIGAAEDSVDGVPDHVEPIERQLLQLLQLGLTDQVIANRLGLSERTVGRRVRALMESADARTRFQLGWRAAERGWLDDHDPIP